ncbi:MAG: DegT/DnrJ/EryC1/StrS family aminotransferase [Actinomycetota bacterium]
MREIPFYDAEREYVQLRHEVLPAIDEVLASGPVLQGQAVVELEREVAGLAGRRHGIAVNSCTDALYFALLALGLGPDDEVLVTDFSFVASASCILRCGATPLFVDIHPATFNMDLEVAERLVTSRTRAVISVHLFGQMSDPAAAEAFAQQHDLVVIEDAAQALGASFAGRPAGSVGQASCLSFDPFKTISAPGSGGMVLTDEDEVAERVRLLRYHGRTADRTVESLGFNSQMSTLVAAVLGIKLRHNAEWIRRRRKIAGRYSEALQGSDHLTVPAVLPDAEHVFQKYVVATPHRDALRDHLAGWGVETMVQYPAPLHRHRVFASGKPVRAPNAEDAATRVLSLPVHAFLSDDEVEAVAEAVLAFPRQRVCG